MRPARPLVALGVAAAASLGVLAATPVPAQAAGTAQVSILHAVPNTPVDVCANGKALLTNFQPGTLTSPQTLPSGRYDLKVTAAGAGCGGAAVVEANGVTVPAGANITVVAHLSAGGSPTLTPYVNDVSSIPAGKARLTVRHDAAAPAVDIRAGGTVVVPGLTNPNGRSLTVGAGSVSADVVLAGTGTRVIGPATLPLREGTSTIVYAWGSASQNTLRLAVQTITGLHSSPSGVNAGTGGQAALESVGSDGAGTGGRAGLAGFAGLGALGVLGALAAGGLTWAATRRRTAARSTVG